MDAEFWKQRWQDGQTGWHQETVHPALIEFFPRLELKANDRVFVPLCGESLDMVWLAEQGIQVVGCELSEHALAAFFDKVGLVPAKTRDAEVVRWQAGPYTIYEGDYFALAPTQLKDVAAVYDRASLVALPKEGGYGRKAYLQQMRALFGVDVKTLLITLDYEQSQMDGPPFSVSYEEVISQYAFDHIIEFLSEEEKIDKEPRFKERGLKAITEWVFLMQRYEPAYADFSKPPQNF